MSESYQSPSLTLRSRCCNSREVSIPHANVLVLVVCATVNYRLGNVILYPLGINDFAVEVIEDFTLICI
jgi:hypothetical protein